MTMDAEPIVDQRLAEKNEYAAYARYLLDHRAPNSLPIDLRDSYSGNVLPVAVGLRESEFGLLLGFFEHEEIDVSVLTPASYVPIGHLTLDKPFSRKDPPDLVCGNNRRMSYENDVLLMDDFFAPLVKGSRWKHNIYAFCMDYGQTKLERRHETIDRILEHSSLGPRAERALRQMKFEEWPTNKGEVANRNRLHKSIHIGRGLGKQAVLLSLSVAAQLGYPQIMFDQCTIDTQHVIEKLSKEGRIKTEERISQPHVMGHKTYLVSW